MYLVDVDIRMLKYILVSKKVILYLQEPMPFFPSLVLLKELPDWVIEAQINFVVLSTVCRTETLFFLWGVTYIFSYMSSCGQNRCSLHVCFTTWHPLLARQSPKRLVDRPELNQKQARPTKKKQAFWYQIFCDTVSRCSQTTIFSFRLLRQWLIDIDFLFWTAVLKLPALWSAL